jgi:hypothetical protein
MARLRINAIGGYLDDELTAAGTTLTSDALEAVPEVVAPDYVPIVLSPDGYLGGPFLARITAHTALATTATIEAVDTRGVTLPAGVEWVHAIEAEDWSTVAATVYTDDHTLTLNDAGQVVEMNKATAVTLTVPDDATVDFPVGTVIEVCNIGAGLLTIEGDTGVDVRNEGDLVQWATASLRKRDADEWVAAGAIT